ncbi:LacI family transcriptional regulator [Paenibacillus catalpae]|uniref:LacI family transcriptional regulator n=1 Tax=Paenibacillus catalpae TaxID=1045775 RepID=A0A1I2HGP8_9BACL|nr:substrate-binding domain-containing protein [Paenibacillus catalpae]SFF28829.1 LacI family transcriptional regulator [Paenibacillus catalpae]
MRGKVTIQEIADMAGVSKFAVSRALTGKAGVSAATREMIYKVAGQLGYFKNNEPKRFAGEMQEHVDRKRSGTIVILFPNIRYQNKESVYWGPVFDGISARLNQQGIDIMTLTEPSHDHVFALVKPEAIQGVITVGSISTPILLDIGRLNIPVVMVDHIDPAFPCDTVFTDNYSCMQNLMTKLVSKGYRKFQFVGNISDAQSYFERWLAFRTTLESYGISLNQDPLLIGPDGNDMYKLFPQLELKELPEVFVCSNDTTAQYLVDELDKRNISVPGDCAVTGFDNTCDTHPILGTVNVNKELLGMRAVDQMLWRIANPESAAEKKLIQGDPIIREQYAYTRDSEAVSE